ncbi:DUF397 domain-containing protein [Streptomyces sp. NPDC058470]|uniref:DUF397 domain-containing protein n=1 Tax=Streptomyces sp. NPDC058470 TaxID=3346515 RepID=UPI003655F5A6
MSTHDWQKSSYCQEGDACVHVAATAETVHLTESSDLTRAILSTHPDTFATLLRALKKNDD